MNKAKRSAFMALAAAVGVLPTGLLAGAPARSPKPKPEYPKVPVRNRIQFDRTYSYVRLVCGHWRLVVAPRGEPSPEVVPCSCAELYP